MKPWTVAVTVAAAGLAGVDGLAGAADIAFSDQTTAAGVDVQHQLWLPSVPPGQGYFYAGGAVGDFDGDGWLDLFVLNGGAPDWLFINNGDGTFTDRAAAWGLVDIHVGVGASAADYDDDGHLDLYVTSFGDPTDVNGAVGKNRLYRNGGDGSFTEVAAVAGVATTTTIGPANYGSSWGDYDLDGDLDLYVAHWVASSQGNVLFRNDGDGTFTNVTVEAGVWEPSMHGFQRAFADMDHDGLPELLVASDFGTSRYYRNDGDGTFTNVTQSAGLGLDEFGMGQTVGDVDNDGRLDWYVTSIFQDNPPPGIVPGNMLYLNAGTGPGVHQYEEVSMAAGVSDGGWGWGTVAVDLDHDGWLDLVEVNGRPGGGEWDGEMAKLFRNAGDGTFDEIAEAAGLVDAGIGCGLVAFDYDGDGDRDVVIFNNGGPMKLYRNDTPRSGHWLRVVLDTTPNPRLAPQGFGTRLEILAGGITRVRIVDGRPSYLATGPNLAHVGLGDAATVDELRIEWPRGYVTTLTALASDQTVVVVAPEPADLDADGDVDGADLGILLARWGAVGAATDRLADLDDDGDVDGADLGLLLAAWSGSG